MPGPVIGGAATVMFAMVTAVGIQTLHKVNFDGNNNLLIVAVSLAAGLLPAVAPELLRALPQQLPGHLRVQHHLHGDRGLHPEHRVQPLDVAAPGSESAVEVAVDEGAVAVDVPQSDIHAHRPVDKDTN